MSAPDTLPTLLEEQAARRPGGIAIRHKHLGIWRELTWRDYAQAVREVALALDELGVGAGDRVAVLAENEPTWLFADLGIQALGAATVGVYPMLDPDEAAAAIRAAGATIVFCDDQEHVDELLAVRDDLPGLERVVVFDTKGLHTPEYADAPLEAFETLQARGRRAFEQRPERFPELLAARHPDEVALVALTAGTTAGTRGVLLAHRGEVALARIVAERISLGEKDRSFSLLPLAHATARLFDVYAHLVAGSSVSFAESYETIEADLVEIAPTVLVATPRLLERSRVEIELRIGRAGWFKRTAYRLAMRGMAAETRRTEHRSGSVGGRLGRALVGRWITAKGGIGKLRYGGIGGSFVQPGLLDWFWALGAPMYQQYGQVESGGIVSAQRGRDDADTAGPPVSPDVEARLNDDGELLVRSPGLPAGTIGDDPLPLDDGWLRTGDLARIDEQGRIVPLGRRTDVLVTTAGHEVPAMQVESTLRMSPYIAGAVLAGAGRPFVTALIEMHEHAVADWARHHGIRVTTYASLVGNERVLELIGREVGAQNASLPEAWRVATFRLLPQPLREEVTPTGNVRRAVVEERHAELIEEMYAGPPARPTVG